MKYFDDVSCWETNCSGYIYEWMEKRVRIADGWRLICSLSPTKTNLLRIVTRKIKPLIVRFLPIWRRGRWKAKA